MELVDSNHRFELVYEGPADDSADTIRKLKGVLIADLELSIPEVQSILANAPVSIKSSDKKEALGVPYSLLKTAGAKVLIVERKSPAEHTEEVESFEIESVHSGDETALVDMSESEDSVVFEFDEPSEPPPPKEPKVHHLDLDAPLFEIEQYLTETPPPQAKSLFEEVKSELQQKKNTDSLALDLSTPAPTTPTPTPAVPEIIQTLELSSASSIEIPTPTVKIPEPSIETPKLEVPSIPNEFSLELASDPLSSQTPEPHLDLAPEEPEKPTQEAVSFEYDLGVKPETPVVEVPATPENALSNKLHAALDLALDVPGDNSQATSPAPQIEIPTLLKTSTDTDEPALDTETETDRVYEVKTDSDGFPAQQSESIPSTENPEALNLDPKPKASRRLSRVKRPSHIPWDIVLPILVGSFVLGLGNWLYFSGKTPNSTASYAKYLLELEDLNGQPDGDSKRKAAKSAPKNNNKGKAKDGTTNVDWNLNLIDDQVLGSIVFSYPAPPKLSAQDLLQGKKQEPWIRKIELSGIKLDKADTDFYQGNATAKVYVELPSEVQRFIATAQVSVRKLGGGGFSGAMELHSGTKQQPGDNATFRFNSAGDYSLNVTGKF